jgi:hypothetical protein
MSRPTNTKTPNPSNPSSLKSRYEIRKLRSEHIPWATAILAHSHGFHSTIWQYIWPDRKLGQWVLAGATKLEYLVAHQIDSGLSYGVFDTEYAFKTKEAKEVGGKLFWDVNELEGSSVEQTQGRKAEGLRLLQQMDFPLVGIALSYDGFVPLDPAKMGPLLESLPEFSLLYGILEKRDPRDPSEWKATAPGQVLMRNATSTRHDYEGEGLASGMARWLRREAASMGFRGIQIECIADAVTYLWSDGVEEPFKPRVISEFDTETWEDENGDRPFALAKQRCVKCWVDL